MTIKSCLYEGVVRHRRNHPVKNHFSYKLYMSFIDLAELPKLFQGRWFWSVNRANIASFKRSDYHGSDDIPLDVAVRNSVEAETGVRPNGPIRLMTHLRYFGYIFNPVSFYFVYNEADTKVETILAEITNTPWGERRFYVLDDRKNQAPEGSRRFRFSLKKDFHISPFMDIDYQYDWRFTVPDERFVVHMENLKNGRLDFDATMTMNRVPHTAQNLSRVLINFPFMTGKVITGIYWQAFKLWMKGVPIQDHPRKSMRIHEHKATN